MRRKTHKSAIQQMAFSFEEISPETVQESSEPMEVMPSICLTEQEARDESQNTTHQQEKVDVPEYNREKAIARFIQIGDDLGLNDKFWETSWRSKSDEQLQTSLAIWEQYYEDVRSGRKIRPIHSKIGERTR